MTFRHFGTMAAILVRRRSPGWRMVRDDASGRHDGCIGHNSRRCCSDGWYCCWGVALVPWEWGERMMSVCRHLVHVDKDRFGV